jgi:hypothetical protein
MAQEFGIRFTPQVVGNDAAPTLPNEQRGVTMAQAISTAMDAAPSGVDYHAHTLLPGVQATAQYGLFSDDRYGQMLPSGRRQLYLQDRPAWVVTLSGVQLPSHGPRRAGAVHPAGADHNEVNIVIDAATGQYLMGYSYR